MDYFRCKNFRHAEFISASHDEPSPEFLQLASSLRILPSPKGRGDKKVAFTLAETLITLGIIGIVAALVIPGWVESYQERQNVIKLQKTYAIIQNAFNLAIAEHGPISTWIPVTPDTNDPNYNGDNIRDCHYVWDKITPYLNIAKECTGKSHKADTCFYWSQYKTFHNNVDNSFNRINYFSWSCKATLNNGASIGIQHIPWYLKIPDYGHIYGGFRIDITGSKGPNTLDKDAFYFILTDKGLSPQGNEKLYMGWPVGDELGMSSPGYRSAWVIYNGNMDYLHCSDKLSWDGPYTCKEAKARKK